MKLAWLTDIHLNFIDENTRKKYYQDIVNIQCDGVLISGDIAEAPSLVDLLTEMVKYIKKPIYFILGNHDYYKGKIDEVRDAMKLLSEVNEQLYWLPASGMQQLGDDTILIGQDGWADGRLGDYQNSSVMLNDSLLIADLLQEQILGRFQLLQKMQQLADTDAMQLQKDLELAVNQHPKKIIVLTHIPPFKEACLYMGKIRNDNWLPYLSCKAVGDVLMKIAQKSPQTDFLVLCGHTHNDASYQPLNNLLIRTGKAEYRYPEIQCLINS